MNFLKSLWRSLSYYPASEVVDIGNGLPWFNEYHAQKCPPLAKFFGLEEKNAKTIESTVDFIGSYQLPQGKRWCLVTKYFDNNQQKEFKFYLPGWEDIPREYQKDSKIDVLVDKNDYSKYEMPGLY